MDIAKWIFETLHPKRMHNVPRVLNRKSKRPNKIMRKRACWCFRTFFGFLSHEECGFSVTAFVSNIISLLTWWEISRMDFRFPKCSNKAVKFYCCIQLRLPYVRLWPLRPFEISTTISRGSSFDRLTETNSSINIGSESTTVKRMELISMSTVNIG